MRRHAYAASQSNHTNRSRLQNDQALSSPLSLVRSQIYTTFALEPGPVSLRYINKPFPWHVVDTSLCIFRILFVCRRALKMYALHFFVSLLPLILGAAEPGQVFIIRDTASGGSGCGKALPSGVKPGALGTNISTTSFGVPRSYLLHVPANYNATKPTPLYFSFHGADRNATEQEGLSQFSNPFFNPNGIAVYPQG